MKKKYKLLVFISSLLLVFIVFLFVVFRPYKYEKKYIINKFKINETYDKKNSSYIFKIDINNISYPYVIESKYIRKKELIKDIKVYNKKDETCILPLSDYMEFYPLCSSNNSIYTYNLSEIENISYNFKKIKNLDKKYNDIIINKINDLSFLIYNYKGFYLINDNKLKNIDLFNKDNYSLDLVYQLNNYLLVPNYDQKYYFNKMFLIDITDGKVKEIESDIDISFDSFFIGDYKNNIYLLDKKEEKEYLINIKKRKIEETGYKIIKDNKVIKSTYKEILKNLNNKEKKLYEYEVIDKELYKIIDNIKLKLTNRAVDKIVSYDNNSIYYISGEDLYMFSNIYGEVLLLSYFEWNFNNTNVIYLYK